MKDKRDKNNMNDDFILVALFDLNAHNQPVKIIKMLQNKTDGSNEWIDPPTESILVLPQDKSGDLQNFFLLDGNRILIVGSILITMLDIDLKQLNQVSIL